MPEQLPALKGLKVTVTDVETGTLVDERVILDDYFLLCHGTRYLKSSQVWGSTHQLNIAYHSKKKRQG